MSDLNFNIILNLENWLFSGSILKPISFVCQGSGCFPSAAIPYFPFLGSKCWVLSLVGYSATMAFFLNSTVDTYLTSSGFALGSRRKAPGPAGESKNFSSGALRSLLILILVASYCNYVIFYGFWIIWSKLITPGRLATGEPWKLISIEVAAWLPDGYFLRNITNPAK